MPVFEIAKIMPCDLDATWRAVVDFPARTIHCNRYRRSDLPDGAEPMPGHRILLQVGRDRFTSVITAVQRPNSLSHRTVGPGFWTEYSYQLRDCDESDAGFTNEDIGLAFLTVRAEYGGWLGGLIARLRPGACRRYLEDELGAIVSAAESVPAEPVDSAQPNLAHPPNAAHPSNAAQPSSESDPDA